MAKVACVAALSVLLGCSRSSDSRPHEWSAITFSPPHAVAVSRARVSRALLGALDAAIEEQRPRTAEEGIQLALRFTSRWLSFGLGHRTRLDFAAARREGNCIEFAHLFARTFASITGKVGIPARAFVVRSGDPRVLGVRIPHRAFRDHDWVVVEQGSDGKRWYVDPSFFSLGMAWDIRARVKGTVSLPR